MWRTDVMKTLKDLFLALLNATLILVALCLFLGWRMMATVDTVSDRVTASIAELTPLRDEIAGVRAELSGLRADLAAAPGTVASARLQNRLDGLETRLDGMQARMASLATLPDQLLDRAFETAADRMARGVAELRGCQPAPGGT